MRRYYERYSGSLPNGEETLGYVFIAVILLCVGYFILKNNDRQKNENATLGCLGIVAMIGGVFCLLPLLLWVERIALVIIPLVLVIGFVIYTIIALLGNSRGKTPIKEDSEIPKQIPTQEHRDIFEESTIEADYYLTTINDTYIQNWWSSMSEEWRLILKENLNKTKVDLGLLRRLHQVEKFSIVGKAEKYSQGYAGITDLEPINLFTELKELKIDHAEITSISGLRNMKKLQKLFISSTYISDLSVLKNLKDLVHLEIVWCQKVTSIKPLRHLHRLTHLSVCGCGVFDLEPIAELTGLETIDLHNLKALRTLKPLRKLTKLKKLGLYGDVGVMSLEGLEEMYDIEHIELNGTSVSSLEPLLNLKKLEFLCASNTKVPKDSLEKLKQRFPDGTIY